MCISYNDSELACFHPRCGAALEEALERLKLHERYQVQHHKTTGSLEMDFVIENKITKKYLCVVEVKRTPAAVNSTRYQLQAMSYVQINAERTERPYYILTNLEYALSFRYDANRPNPFQQILTPGFCHIGSFSNTSKEEHHQRLTQYFCERLKEYTRDHRENILTLHDFEAHMEQVRPHARQWKAHLAVLLYEYIRGAFSSVNRKGLNDVRSHTSRDVAAICRAGKQVNFADIFNYSHDTFEPQVQIEEALLSQLYKFGRHNGSGDAIASLLHYIVSSKHEHEGEIPTDMELARIVAELAQYISGPLNATDCICDPAAGSGNLISAAIPVYQLKPTQIIVNERNGQLMELLSLRLGLKYVETVSPANTAQLHNKNLADMTPEDFRSVKVVVMNPPFLAGINSKKRKETLYRKIALLTKRKAQTNAGQMPLEAVFLELVTKLVQPGTTIACVFPKTHLQALGSEAQTIRKLLLEQFGLQLIFTYPSRGIFNNVTTGTCVLLGKAKRPGRSVTIVTSYTEIPNIDITALRSSLTGKLTADFSESRSGIAAKKVSTRTLSAELKGGWNKLNLEVDNAAKFIKKHFHNSEKFQPLQKATSNIKRGTIGNGGGSDLTFFNNNRELSAAYPNETIILSPAIRNARTDNFELINAPDGFLDVTQNRNEVINAIIRAYVAQPAKEGKQKRHPKSAQEWKDKLTEMSRQSFAPNSVLIPRAIRTHGRCYLTRLPLFVSTNFVVCSFQKANDALLMSTWMTTIFYQLHCEVSAKDQEGMRKMEVKAIRQSYVPKAEKISDATIQALADAVPHLHFLQLSTPTPREIDQIWANELFGDQADAMLREASALLEFLVKRRNPPKQTPSPPSKNRKKPGKNPRKTSQ